MVVEDDFDTEKYQFKFANLRKITFDMSKTNKYIKLFKSPISFIQKSLTTPYVVDTQGLTK